MILGNGFCQHIFGDSGGGGLFVPAAAFQPVADKLFVKRRGIAADLVALRRPEAAGIGGEHFVHQGERAVGIQPEFKFGVGDDDAAGGSVGSGFGVELDGFGAYLLGKFAAD